jgi:hypothetical protein
MTCAGASVKGGERKKNDEESATIDRVICAPEELPVSLPAISREPRADRKRSTVRMISDQKFASGWLTLDKRAWIDWLRRMQRRHLSELTSERVES